MTGCQLDEIQVSFEILKACCRSKIQFSALFSQGTALFQHILYIFQAHTTTSLLYRV